MADETLLDAYRRLAHTHASVRLQLGDGSHGSQTLRVGDSLELLCARPSNVVRDVAMQMSALGVRVLVAGTSAPEQSTRTNIGVELCFHLGQLNALLQRLALEPSAEPIALILYGIAPLFASQKV